MFKTYGVGSLGGVHRGHVGIIQGCMGVICGLSSVWGYHAPITSSHELGQGTGSARRYFVVT